MTDDRLRDLLRTGMPPIGEPDPPRDLWPGVIERLDRGVRWSLLDFGLAAAVVTALLMFPESLWLLFYNL